MAAMLDPVPGPQHWMSPGVLRNLQSLGLSSEIPDLMCIAAAAKCRVHKWECHSSGGVQITRRITSLRLSISSSPYYDRKAAWGQWLSSNFFELLQRAEDSLQALASSSDTSVPLLLQGTSAEPVAKKDWQRRCRSVLSRVDDDVIPRHLRRKLDSFRMSILPGHRVRRATLLLRGLARNVPPRVWFATLKALCDGWTTHARFQRRRPCLFGCGAGEDSLHHYAFCRVVGDFACRRLHLGMPAAEHRVETFLALSPIYSDAAACELARRALCLFAVHSATNAARHCTVSDPAEALGQFVREACAAHVPLSRILAAVESR